MAPTTQVDIAGAALHQNGAARLQAKGAVALVKCNPALAEEKVSIRGVVAELMAAAHPGKAVLPLGVGDASSYACFRGGRDASTSLVESASSSKFDGYAPSFGYPFARRAVAEYLSWGVTPSFEEKDVFLTVGGTQALQICVTVLATRGSNILLPRPGFPPYESACEINGIEPRFYNLKPDSNWEVDLDHVRKVADSHTTGIVIINPNNPCGAVYSRAHLVQIAETAAELNLAVVADEIYGHMVFRGGRFVPMASLAHIAPVLTIGALSKRWLVPGWRLGWVGVKDHVGSLRLVKQAIERLMNVALGPSSIIQATLPTLLSDSDEDFHKNVRRQLEFSENTLFTWIERIEALKCRSRPQGSMFTMVEIDTSVLEGISDDMDFAMKLMKEESVLVLPGTVIGLKNWIRIFFGAPADLLEEACKRIKSFCERSRRSQHHTL